MLDTHVLLWLLGDSENLSPAVRAALDEQDRCVSIASLWEIAIKKSLADPKRRLYLDMSITDIAEECNRQGIRLIMLSPNDCERVGQLPHLHEDPFDRIIIAQALERNLSLITRDERIWRYDCIGTIW